jgi:hypothetical protein
MIALMEVAQIQLLCKAHCCRVEPLLFHVLQRSPAQLGKDPVDLVDGMGGKEPDCGPQIKVAHVGLQQTMALVNPGWGGTNAGMPRSRARVGGMQRACAAEGEERKTARILPPALEGEAQIDCHVGVDDLGDAGRSRDQIEPERAPEAS